MVVCHRLVALAAAGTFVSVGGRLTKHFLDSSPQQEFDEAAAAGDESEAAVAST